MIFKEKLSVKCIWSSLEFNGFLSKYTGTVNVQVYSKISVFSSDLIY